jgi:hypothetical protein
LRHLCQSGGSLLYTPTENKQRKFNFEKKSALKIGRLAIPLQIRDSDKNKDWQQLAIKKY